MKKTEKKLSQETPVSELESPSVQVKDKDFSFLDDGKERIALFYKRFADSNNSDNHTNFLHIHKIRLPGEVLTTVEEIRHFLRKNAPIEVYVKDVDRTGKN